MDDGTKFNAYFKYCCVRIKNGQNKRKTMCLGHGTQVRNALPLIAFNFFFAVLDKIATIWKRHKDVKTATECAQTGGVVLGFCLQHFPTRVMDPNFTQGISSHLVCFILIVCSGRSNARENEWLSTSQFGFERRKRSCILCATISETQRHTRHQFACVLLILIVCFTAAEMQKKVIDHELFNFDLKEEKHVDAAAPEHGMPGLEPGMSFPALALAPHSSSSSCFAAKEDTAEPVPGVMLDVVVKKEGSTSPLRIPVPDSALALSENFSLPPSIKNQSKEEKSVWRNGHG